jgi:glycine cleavage system aminomethyltransferase T
VSVPTSAGRADIGLDALLRRAGGVFASRRGAPVVVNFGSAAGELAACVSAAGLADRSELVKLELTAPAPTLSAVVTRVAGGTVAVGGALLANGAWWCGLSRDRVIVLSDPETGRRLRDHLHARAVQHPDLRLIDRTLEWAALEVVGRRTAEVLEALGVFGERRDPRQVPPLTSGHAGAVPALWLLRSDHHALALVARERAGEAWTAIDRAGERSGICCVGQDAVARYELLERRPGVAPV